jgi:hypothetical protein
LLVGSPTKGSEGVENGLLFMTLNGSPTKHCLLHSIKEVGSDTAEADVETRAAAANIAKWSEWEGGSEREEREKVSYELILLL